MKATGGLTATDEQLAGINIIRRAAEAPLRFIAENAGLEGSIAAREAHRSTLE